MSRPLVFRPEAEREIADAAEWYEARRQGLSADFLRALDAAMASIGRNPLQYPLIYREMRRALLRRFPYAVIFTVTGDAVVILACAHGRQQPRRWQRRR